MLGLVRSKYLPGGLHGSEGLLSSCCLQSCLVQEANTPALSSLLDVPWGSDPAFFIVWNRFRQLSCVSS